MFIEWELLNRNSYINIYTIETDASIEESFLTTYVWRLRIGYILNHLKKLSNIKTTICELNKIILDPVITEMYNNKFAFFVSLLPDYKNL